MGHDRHLPRPARGPRGTRGHPRREGSQAQADELAARLRRPEPADRDAITLGELFDNYVREVTPGKTASKQAHDRRTAKLALEVLGPARRAADLTHRDAERFVAERRRRGDRRSTAESPRPLRARALAYDLAFLRVCWPGGWVLDGCSAIRSSG